MSTGRKPFGGSELILCSTGVTGFIGGDVLHGLTQTLTASSIVALVRNKSQAAVVAGRFPTVIPLIADLDSSVEIQKAASTADVVLRMFQTPNPDKHITITMVLTSDMDNLQIWQAPVTCLVLRLSLKDWRRASVKAQVGSPPPSSRKKNLDGIFS